MQGERQIRTQLPRMTAAGEPATVPVAALAEARAGDLRCKTGVVTDDNPFPAPETSSNAVATITQFFADYQVAGLELPSGWFGRPFDDLHRLTKARDGNSINVRLDGTQDPSLDVESVHCEPRILRLRIRGGTREWTSYGSDERHQETLVPGLVIFHAMAR